MPAVPHISVYSQLWSLNQLHYADFERKLKARKVPKLDKRITFSARDTFADKPRASKESGFYDDRITVALIGTRGNGRIYYTLDGSIPTARSNQYNDPLNIDRTAVLRFRTFRRNSLPSATVTHSYFLREKFSLPLVSVTIDPINLENKYSGIYRNFKRRGREWSREAHIEFFDQSGRMVIRFPGEIAIHGGQSRWAKKKSFRIKYVPPEGSIHTAGRGARILSEKSLGETVRTVILRTGIDRKKRIKLGYGLGDPLFNSVFSPTHGYTAAFVPVVVAINGRAFGIYNLYERIDSDYISRHFGGGEYDLVYWGPDAWQALSGDLKHWERTFAYLSNEDLSEDDVMQQASGLIDLQNLTDYWIANVYAGNRDWPHTNNYFFRARTGEDRRWRWIAWDADFAFDSGAVTHNTLAWSVRRGLRHDLKWNGVDREYMVRATAIMRALLENVEYKQYFITRFCDLLNSMLSEESVQRRFDGLLELLEEDILSDLERWGFREKAFRVEAWGIREYIKRRPDVVRGHLREYFGLGKIASVELFVQPAGAGTIRVNSMTPERFPWKGQYFRGSEVELSAEPRK